MKNEMELLKLGQAIAAEFITRNTPLSDSLLKVATEENLNREQIRRVAETANQESYLKLIEKSADKYIEFPLADADAVYTGVQSKLTKVASYPIEDYADIIKEKEFSFTMFDKNFDASVFEKQASGFTSKDVSALNTLGQIVDYIDNQMSDNITKLASVKDKILFATRQYVLSEEAPYNYCKEVIKEASAQNAESLINYLDTELSRVLNNKILTKEAALVENSVINRNTDYYKLANSYNEICQELDKLAAAEELYLRRYNTLRKEASEHLLATSDSPLVKKISETYGFKKEGQALGLWGKAKRAVKIGAGLAAFGGGTLAVGAGIGTHLQKQREASGQLINKYTATMPGQPKIM